MGTQTKDDTQPNADEVARLEAINRELCRKIVDLEADVERKKKAVEGFMAENEALKEELGGRRRNTVGRRNSRQDQLTARIERWRKSAKGKGYG